MPSVNLQNITIKKLEDKNFNNLIVNNDNQDEAYFCFERTVKEGWSELVQNWEKIKEVEIEFTESEQGFRTYRRAVNIYVSNKEEFII